MMIMMTIYSLSQHLGDTLVMWLAYTSTLDMTVHGVCFPFPSLSSFKRDSVSYVTGLSKPMNFTTFHSRIELYFFLCKT